MYNSPILIDKIIPAVYYKNTQLNDPTNQNLIKVPKVFTPMDNKILGGLT